MDPRVHYHPDVGTRAGILWLFVAMALLALSGPLVRWLSLHGPEAGIVGREAISFCNVLFVGNTAAGILVLTLRGPRRVASGLSVTLRARPWSMIASIALAALIPALLFTALEHTTVTSVILLGRIEPLLFAVLGVAFLGGSIRKTQWLGYGVTVAGLIALVLFQGMGSFGKGETLVLGAAVATAVSGLVGKRALEACDLHAFVFARNLGSAVAFFAIAVWYYGFEHFADAFRGDLWIAMLAYALIAIVAAQLAWFRALGSVTPESIANWSFVSPVLGVTYAWILLGERPAIATVTAGAIVLVGVVIASRGGREPARTPEESLACSGR